MNFVSEHLKNIQLDADRITLVIIRQTSGM